VIEDPQAGCVDLRFAEGISLSSSGEVALEDYARVVTRARHAEAIPHPGDPASIAGVHVCAPETPPGDAMRADIESFAREMEIPAESGGLGWN
jgi:hypothetical protein